MDYMKIVVYIQLIHLKIMTNIMNTKIFKTIIIIHKKGYSHKEINNFEDNFFDGNHEPEYVLEDAVLSFRKLKINGIMIFDDYGWGGDDLTKRGIDAFLSGYHKRIKHLGMSDIQVFIMKLK